MSDTINMRSDMTILSPADGIFVTKIISAVQSVNPISGSATLYLHNTYIGRYGRKNTTLSHKTDVK